MQYIREFNHEFIEVSHV